MKDNRTILLGLLSVGLLGTWAYHFYDKNNYVNRLRSQQAANDTITVAGMMKDSLNEVYSKTVSVLDTSSVNMDSIAALKGELGEKMREIHRLKNDIGGILRKKQVTLADLKDAKALIKDLQLRVANMQDENNSLAEEKSRLNNILDLLNKEMSSLQTAMEKVSTENREMAKAIDDASIFVASEMRIAAMNLRTEEKEEETNSVKKADKFVVSFVVQNYLKDVPGAELVIAISEPTGKIMIGEGWNTGSFDAKDGKKEYTRKVRFEYIKGEQKRLIFSVQTEKFQKGVYKLNVYHNGVMIGEASWMLS